jgi:hypothetical protein
VAPGPFTRALYQAERQFFEPQPDGPLEDYVVQDGLIYRACDGTFEDRLFHEGLARTACTETPGRLDLERGDDREIPEARRSARGMRTSRSRRSTISSRAIASSNWGAPRTPKPAIGRP